MRRYLRSIILSFFLVLIITPLALADTYHTVREGDNLWTLARKYNTTVDKIKKLNNMNSDFLSLGKKLLISKSVTATFTPVQNQTVYTTVTPSRSSTGPVSAQNIIEFGSRFLGTPYRYGGSGPGGFDCSGFVSYCFRQFGYNLPRTAAGMAGVGTHVDKSNLQAGDLVFFQGPGAYSINHVGIYVGSNKFIHSSSGNYRGIVYSSLSDAYYSSYYAGARRILDTSAQAINEQPETNNENQAEEVDNVSGEPQDGASLNEKQSD